MISGNAIGQNNPTPPQDNSYQNWYSYYQSTYEANEEEDDDSDAAQFMKWAHFWENRLVDDDIQIGMAKANAFMQDFIDGGLTVCEGNIDDAINWESLGPFNSDGALENGSANCNIDPQVQSQGRIEAISVRPAPLGQIPTEIVVGGYNGGIWKTTNADAEDPDDVLWENTTYDEGYSMVGIKKLVRHPQNPDIIYAATGGDLGVWWSSVRSWRNYVY